MFENLKEKIKNKKVIVFGEIHGTKEIPETILNFLKNLDEDFDICLEIPEEFQNNLSDFFKEKPSDGRNSKEYLNLIKELSKLNKNIFCIDPIVQNQKEKEEGLAKNSLTRLGNKKVFLILGEVHASKEKIIFNGQEIIPTGYLLKEKLKEGFFNVRLKPSKGKYFNFGIRKIDDTNDEFDKSFDYILNLG